MKTIKMVEKNLQKLLDKYKLSSKLTIAQIKDWIFNDEGESAMDASNRFQKKWHKYFARVKNMDELNYVFQHFIDAWNYFPHQSLAGRSPDQVFKEESKKSPVPRGDKKEIPKVIVGGREMSWDEYEAMIKEMGKRQKPFKAWTDNVALPNYKNYLEHTAGKDTLSKHYEVADIFFERVIHVGFITFDQIRKDFIQKEFPHWWQTHVMMSNLKEKEVLSSLKKLFQFIALNYKRDVSKFGF